MKNLKIPVLFLFAVAANMIFAETPVLVADYQVDTSLYYDEPYFTYKYAPSPLIHYNESRSTSYQDFIVEAFRKKTVTKSISFQLQGNAEHLYFHNYPPIRMA